MPEPASANPGRARKRDRRAAGPVARRLRPEGGRFASTQARRPGRTDGRIGAPRVPPGPPPILRRGRPADGAEGPPREAARAFRGPTPGTGTRLTPRRGALPRRGRFESVRELVERLLDRGLVGERRRCPAADPLQPAGTELVTGEEPVHVRALDPAVGAHRAVRASFQVREGPGRVGTRGRAHVDLVSGDRRGASRAGPVTGRTDFSPRITVSTSSRARPGASPAGPSPPSGSRTHRPSI